MINKNEFIKAATDNDVKKLKEILLINKDNKNFSINCVNTALFEACVKGNFEAADYLIKRGAKVDINDKRPSLGFQLACQNGRTKVIELLINNGAPVNYTINSTWTLLSDVSNRGYYEAAEIILNAGAVIDRQDFEGKTALMVACSGGQKSIIELLLERGANLNIRDNNGETAFTRVCGTGEKQLIELFFDRDKELDIEITNHDGETPLINCIFCGKADAIGYLLSKGADINAKDNCGNTALMHLCTHSRPIRYPDEQLEVALFLIDNGADCHLENNDGKTFLDLSTPEFKAIIEKILLDREVEPTEPAKVFADRSAQELKKLKARDRDRDRDRDRELSMGL